MEPEEEEFVFIETPKPRNLNNEWKKIRKLNVDEFWEKKSIEMLRDFEGEVKTLSEIKIKQEDCENSPERVVHLFQLVQCLLEVKTQYSDDLDYELKEFEAVEEERDNLQKKVKSLKKEIKKLKTEAEKNDIRAAKREIDDLESELEQWKGRCNDKDNALSQVNTELSQEKSERRQAETEVKNLARKLQSVQEEIKRMNAAERTMRGRYQEDDKKIQDLEEVIEKVEREKDDLLLELEELTSEHTKVQKDLEKKVTQEKEYKLTIKNATNEIRDKVTDIEERDKKIIALKEKIEAYEQKEKELREDYEEQLELANTRFEEQKKQMTEDVKRREKDLIELEEKVNILSEEKEILADKAKDYGESAVGDDISLRQEIVLKDKELDEIKEDFKELMSENKQLKKKLQEHGLFVKEIVPEEKTVPEDLYLEAQEKIIEIQKDKDHIQEEFKVVTEEFSQLEIELTRAKNHIKDLESGIPAIEIAKRDIRYYREQVQKREETIERYKKMLNKFLNNVQDLTYTINDLYRQYEHPKAKQFDFASMDEKIRADLLETLLAEEKTKLEEKYKVLLDDMKRKKKELEDRLKEKGTLSEENDVLRDQLKKYQNQIAELEANIEDSNITIADLEKKLDISAQDIAELEERINILMANKSDQSVNVGNFEVEAKLKRKIRELQDRESELTNENHDLQAKISDLERTIHESKGQQLTSDQIDATSEEVNMMKERLRQSIENLQASQSREKDLEGRLNLISEQLKQLKRLQEDLKLQSEENEELRALNTQLNERVDKMQRIIEKLKARQNPVKEIVREISKNEGSAVDDLESQLRLQEEQLSRLREDYEIESTLHSETKKMHANSNSKLSQMRQQLTETMQKLELVNGDNHKLKNQLAKQNKEYLTILHQAKKATDEQNDFHSLKLKLMDIQKQLRDTQRDLEERSEDLKIVQDENQHLKSVAEGNKMAKKEWEQFKERLQFTEQEMLRDQERSKLQFQQTMGDIISGYNVLIEQKEMTIDRCSQQLEKVRQELIEEKKRAHEEINKLKKMLKMKDNGVLDELKSQLEVLEIDKPIQVQAPAGMTIEHVEEMLQEKNRNIELLSSENQALVNQLNGARTLQQKQFENFKKMKTHLQDTVKQQEKQIRGIQYELSNERAKKGSQTIKKKTATSQSLAKTSKSQIPIRKSIDVRNLKKELEQARSELEMERSKTERLENTIENLTQSLVDSETALAVRQEHEGKEMNAKIKRLAEQKLSSQKSAVKKLRKDLAEMKSAEGANKKTLKKIQDQLVEALKEIEAKHDVIQRQLGIISRLKQKEGKLKDELTMLRQGDMLTDAKAQVEIDRLKKRIHVLEHKQSNTLQTEVDSLRFKLASDHEKMLQTKKAGDRLLSENKSLVEAHRAQLQKQRELQHAIEKERDSLRRERDEALLQIERLEGNLTDLKEVHKSEMAKLQTKYKEELEQTRNSQNSSQSVRKLEKEIAQMKARHNTEKESLSKRIVQEKSKLKEKLTQQSKNLVLRETEIRRLREELKKAPSSDFFEKIPQYNELNEKYFNLRKEHEKLKTDRKKEVQDLKIELKRFHEETEWPLNTDTEMKSRINQLADELERERKEKVDLLFEKERMASQESIFRQELDQLKLIQTVQEEYLNQNNLKMSSKHVQNIFSKDAQEISKKKSKEDLECLVEVLKKVIGKLQIENENLRKTSISNYKYMDEMAKSKRLKERLKEKDEQIKKLKEDVGKKDKLSARVTKLLENNTQLSKKLRKEREICAKVKREKFSLENRVEQFEKEKKDQELKQVSRERAIESRQKILLQDEQKKNKELIEKGKRIKKELLSKNEKLEQDVEEKENAIIELIKRNEELEKDLEAVKGKENEEMDNSTINKPDVSKQQEREINFLRQQVLKYQSESSELREQLKASKSKESLEKEINRLKSENLSLLKSNEKLQTELNYFDPEFFEEIEDMKYTNMKTKKENEAMKKQLKELGVTVSVDESHDRSIEQEDMET